MGSYKVLGPGTIFLLIFGTSFTGKVFFSMIIGINSSRLWSLLLPPITMEQHLSTASGMDQNYSKEVCDFLALLLEVCLIVLN